MVTPAIEERCCCLMADLGFIPLVFWHPSTVLVIHWRCGQVLGTQGGDLCPVLCSPVCICAVVGVEDFDAVEVYTPLKNVFCHTCSH
jgi:hypothetical protein